MSHTDDVYWKCQSVMLGTYKYLQDHFTSSKDRLDSIKRLGREEGCTELFPQLKKIMEDISVREERAKFALATDTPHYIKEVDEALAWLEKFRRDDASTVASFGTRCLLSVEKTKREKSEVAHCVLRDYKPLSDIESMFDWRIKYEIWCRKYQGPLISAFTAPVSFMVARYVLASNHRTPVGMGIFCSWIVIASLWSSAINNNKHYIG